MITDESKIMHGFSNNNVKIFNLAKSKYIINPTQKRGVKRVKREEISKIKHKTEKK